MERTTSFLQSSQSENGTSWRLFWLFVVIGLVAVIVAWQMRRKLEETTSTVSPDAAAPEPPPSSETDAPRTDSVNV